MFSVAVPVIGGGGRAEASALENHAAHLVEPQEASLYAQERRLFYAREQHLLPIKKDVAPRNFGSSLLLLLRHPRRPGLSIPRAQQEKHRGARWNQRPGKVRLHERIERGRPHAVHLGGARRRGRGPPVGQVRGPGGAHQGGSDGCGVRVQRQAGRLRGLPGQQQDLLEAGGASLQEAAGEGVQGRARAGEGRRVQERASGRALQAGHPHLGDVRAERDPDAAAAGSSPAPRHREPRRADKLHGERERAQEGRAAVQLVVGELLRVLFPNPERRRLLEPSAPSRRGETWWSVNKSST